MPSSVHPETDSGAAPEKPVEDPGGTAGQRIGQCHSARDPFAGNGRGHRYHQGGRIPGGHGQRKDPGHEGHHESSDRLRRGRDGPDHLLSPGMTTDRTSCKRAIVDALNELARDLCAAARDRR